MPQIIITTDAPDGDATEVHRERISTADVETETAGYLLVERIGWALSDANEIEEPDGPTGPAGSNPERAG
ncbi:MAG TPA: hypothetical protein VFH44_04000 [Solirubrobacterales bacterium]|nr:hypothetical protein [Solirubrobacterales bacterium]